MSFFGIGWIGLSLIALFLLAVIVVVSLIAERLVWLPKESAIIEGAQSGKGGPQS